MSEERPVRDQMKLDSGADSTQFLKWAMGQTRRKSKKPTDEYIRAGIEGTLANLAHLAKTHNPKAITSLNEVTGPKLQRYRTSRPAGYAATTWTYIGGIKVITLLDSCATSSGISEELACLFISFFDAEVEAGRISPEAHPVKSVCKYNETSGMQGVGGAVMATKFAIIAAIELVGIGKRPGQGNPVQNVSFKVFPKGQSNVDGLIIGMPVLDRQPFGWDMINMDTCWYLKRFDVQMPKAEAHDRLRYRRDVEQWRKEPVLGRGKEGYHSIAETSSHVGIAEKLLGLCCVYNGEDEHIDSGWTGLVPCKWTGPLPAQPCMAEKWEEDLGSHREGLDVTPGICDPKNDGRETVLEIVNTGPLPITIERGQILAIGEKLPPGLVLVRRGVNPETGEEP